MSSVLTLMALIVFLMVMAIHYFPWRMLIRKPLPHLVEILTDLLIVAVPFSIILAMFQTWTNTDALCAFWALVFSAIAASLISLGIDGYIEARSRAEESKEREDELLERLNKCQE